MRLEEILVAHLLLAYGAERVHGVGRVSTGGHSARAGRYLRDESRAVGDLIQLVVDQQIGYFGA